MDKANIAIFASGRGSNAISIIEYHLQNNCAFVPKLLFTDKSKSNVENIASKYNLDFLFLSLKNFDSKESFEEAIADHLLQYEIKYIILAGYMKLIGSVLLSKYKNKIFNIHPSFLPLYKGLDTHEKAINDNSLFMGASVHMVTEKLDDGKILGQVIIPIEKNDDKNTLATKLINYEHILYPLTVENFIKNELCQNDKEKNELIFSKNGGLFNVR